MAIRLSFPNRPPAAETGSTRFWGVADLPQDTPYPETVITENNERFSDPMTFICQIRCKELAQFDPEDLLPHTGLLSFFAAIDGYMGMDYVEADGYNGIGEWTPDMFRVIWSENITDLHPHEIINDDGTPFGLKAEAVEFTQGAHTDGFRLLGRPFYDEVTEQTAPNLISLLQLDEEDRWNLRFYDCGMLNFLITEDDLRARRFNRTRCFMHSL